MIKGLELSNFKSIGKTLVVTDDGEKSILEFKPLTIFCGSNSSGKSTVLQSILLLAQTLKNNVPSHTLVLNGPLVNLGGVSDIKSEFYKNNDISIGIDIDITKYNENLTYSELEERLSEIGQSEEIYIGEIKQFIKYTLSSNLDVIERVIANETSCAINFNNVKWKLNPVLSDSIKRIMDKHNVTYSLSILTDLADGFRRKIEINKKIDDEWYTVRFVEEKGTIFSDDGNIIEQKDFLEAYKLEENDTFNSCIYFNISFSNKKINDISNKIPILKKIHFISACNMKDIHHPIDFNTYNTGKIKNIKNIITKDKNYECFKFKLDDETKKYIKRTEKLIGLILNHFLPEKFVYLREDIDWSMNFILEHHLLMYTRDSYKFNRYSVSEYNSSMQYLFEKINKYREGKKIDAAQFEIPKSKEVNNESFFKQYVVDSIKKLKNMKIDKLVRNYVVAEINDKNKELDSEFNENYRYIYEAILGKLEPSLEAGVSHITEYFKEKIIYIGPLREEPHLQYDSYIENPIDIGTKGENCSSVLFHNKKKLIDYIDPKVFATNEITTEFGYLLEAVNIWLQYIGIASEISSDFNGRYGYELKIKTVNKSRGNDLTNVGTGVSQVLPIVLSCLLADEWSTIIIEHPELHLHPAMQTKLTDFFIATILCNKQVIIETHSEYIINRLRLRAVNLPSDNKINDSLRIYFTEKLKKDNNDYKAGNTVFRQLEINEYAAMSDWPDGFFDESSKIADEIFKEASKKWKQNMGNKQ